MRRTALLLLLSLALASFCSRQGPAAGEADSRKPTGRTELPGRTPIAAITLRGEVNCSAVLVGPRAILTALHCVSAGSKLQLTFSSPASGEPEEHQIVDVRPAPDFVPATRMGDLAIAQLGHDVNLAPLLMEAFAPTTEILELQGFGGSQATGNQRSSGKVRAEGGEDGVITLTPAPSTGCVGDSGGPVLNKNGAIVGIVASGPPSCEGPFQAMALTPARLAFFRAYVERATQKVASGGGCFSDDQCLTGSCFRPARIQGRGYCTTSCKSQNDCVGKMSCDTKAGLCRPVAGSPGMPGSACSQPWDCLEGVCGGPAGGSSSNRCMRSCAGLDLGCPTGQRCVPARLAAYEVGVRHVCTGSIR